MLRPALFALPVTSRPRAPPAWKVLLRFACMKIQVSHNIHDEQQQFGWCKPLRNHVQTVSCAAEYVFVKLTSDRPEQHAAAQQA